MTRRSERSFVSYIDKSRDYYAAQGYEHPYRWAVSDHVAFTVPEKSLADSRVGVVTTSFFQPGDEPGGVATMQGDGPFRTKAAYAAPTDTAAGATFNKDLSWAKDETHTDDIGSYIPVPALERLAAAGSVGEVGPRFYGVPTEYSQRRTAERDAPQVAQWMTEDGVDLALLVGL